MNAPKPLRPLLPRAAALIVAGGMLAACGSDSNSGGSDAGAPDTVSGRSCQSEFTPERVDRGEDCAPRYFEFCPPSQPDGGIFNFDEVPPCEGVEIIPVSRTGVENSFSGTLDYIVLRPANRAPQSVLVNLHFRQLLRNGQRAAATHAALMRQAELALARDVMIILPGAPDGNWPQSTLSDLVGDLSTGLLVGEILDEILDNGLLDGGLTDSGLFNLLGDLGLPVGIVDQLLDSLGLLGGLGDLVGAVLPDVPSVQDHLDYIELAMFDAFAAYGGGNLPRYMAGLSNGGIYAARFACQRPEVVDAVLVVAGTLGPLEALDCKGVDPVGTVQVHGVLDPLAVYIGGLTFPVRGGQPPFVSEVLDLLPVPVDLSLVEEVLPFEPGLDAVSGLLDILLFGNTDFLAPLLSIGELLPSAGLNQPGLFLDIFGPNNGCSGSLLETVIPAGVSGGGAGSGDVIIERFEQCDNPAGRESIMVTVSRGGHNWPGYDLQGDLEFNLFGPVSRDFDTTIQGFDLLQRAGGHR